ncbi:MAG: Ada metal-binding domain-containing protein, partial [Nitrospiria bacterium]
MFSAAKNTGLFCQSDCPAKSPEQDEGLFYKTTKDALMDGYLPCKVCQPMGLAGKAPEYVATLL